MHLEAELVDDGRGGQFLSLPPEISQDSRVPDILERLDDLAERVDSPAALGRLRTSLDAVAREGLVTALASFTEAAGKGSADAAAILAEVRLLRIALGQQADATAKALTSLAAAIASMPATQVVVKDGAIQVEARMPPSGPRTLKIEGPDGPITVEVS
jgi:hypothetical protein